MFPLRVSTIYYTWDIDRNYYLSANYPSAYVYSFATRYCFIHLFPIQLEREIKVTPDLFKSFVPDTMK